MPATKSKPKPAKPAAPPAAEPTANSEVLTLAEAAAYLRVSEADVVKTIREENLPARRLGEDWRLLKSAIQDWLRSPPTPPGKKDFWKTQLGAFKDDPGLEEMVREIYERRGRPMTEEG
jgi:excisionase family DNA binding protein